LLSHANRAKNIHIYKLVFQKKAFEKKNRKIDERRKSPGAFFHPNDSTEQIFRLQINTVDFGVL
jgi:hypothetical protein